MVAIDNKSYVYVDGVKIARLIGTELEFLDKDPVRIQQRGSRFVKIEIRELFREIIKEGRIEIKK